MVSLQKITPCLWFDSEAEEAARFYVSIFKNSGVEAISRYGKAGFEQHGRPEGSVMVVQFRLEGLRFTALNGGPVFTFSEAVSLQVFCDTQDEIDAYWSQLTADGHEGQCGWLKDRFGLSWQIVPAAIPRWMSDPDPEKVRRVMDAFLPMKKLDIGAIERAYQG
jgi:predicted 3-demethylubiquinone-9 3-methyltransferase (glyoxalase superfamily)